ncbi:MAG: hypothetical protein AAFY73_14715 [Pseudomonadota bacterium]
MRLVVNAKFENGQGNLSDSIFVPAPNSVPTERQIQTRVEGTFSTDNTDANSQQFRQTFPGVNITMPLPGGGKYFDLKITHLVDGIECGSAVLTNTVEPTIFNVPAGTQVESTPVVRDYYQVGVSVAGNGFFRIISDYVNC